MKTLFFKILHISYKLTNLWVPSDMGYPKPNSKIFQIWFTGTQTYFLRPQAKILRKFDPPYCIPQGSIRCGTYQNIKQDNVTRLLNNLQNNWYLLRNKILKRGSANQKYFNKVLYRTPANPQQLITAKKYKVRTRTRY
jgi:hypothetical protein